MFSASRQLLLSILWASAILSTSGDHNKSNKQSHLPNESSPTKVSLGTEYSPDRPQRSNGKGIQNRLSRRARCAPAPESEAEPRRFSLHTRALPWLQALHACWRDGQQLAVPRSAAEAQHLGRLVSTADISATRMRDTAFVGLNDIALEGRWMTVQGEPLAAVGFAEWLSDGAANGPQRNCGALLAGDGRLVAQRCNASLAFVCEPLPPRSRPERVVNETDEPSGEDGYKAVQGIGMYKLHTAALPWASAVAACAREGAALATPETEREAGLLAGLMASQPQPQLRRCGVFTGINDLADEGDWRDYDGIKLNVTGFHSWAHGEPSGYRYCGALLPDGHLADAPCSEPRAFFCKKPAAPRPRRGFVEVTGVGSCRVHREHRDWAAALMECGRENATLALTNSTWDARALGEHIKDLNYIHVGAIAFTTGYSGGYIEALSVFGESARDIYMRYGVFTSDKGKDMCVAMDSAGMHFYGSCDIKRSFVCTKYPNKR